MEVAYAGDADFTVSCCGFTGGMNNIQVEALSVYQCVESTFSFLKLRPCTKSIFLLLYLNTCLYGPLKKCVRNVKKYEKCNIVLFSSLLCGYPRRNK